MNDTTNTVRLRPLDEIAKPLTDILKTGSRQLPARAAESEAGVFFAGAAPSVRCRRGLDRSRLSARGCTTVALTRTGSGFTSLRRFCRYRRGARRAWAPCCRFSICAAFWPAIFRGRLARDWIGMRRTCRRRGLQCRRPGPEMAIARTSSKAIGLLDSNAQRFLSWDDHPLATQRNGQTLTLGIYYLQTPLSLPCPRVHQIRSYKPSRL